MAEEIKQEETKAEGKTASSAVFKIILGLIFLALGVAAIFHWWDIILYLIRGFIGPFFILAGIVTLAIAKD